MSWPTVQAAQKQLHWPSPAPAPVTADRRGPASRWLAPARAGRQRPSGSRMAVAARPMRRRIRPGSPSTKFRIGTGEEGPTSRERRITLLRLGMPCRTRSLLSGRGRPARHGLGEGERDGVRRGAREWGRVDATQADLGCGQDRESIYKAKPPAPLTCYECDWSLHLVHKTHGAYDLWFLRHAANAPHCEVRLAGEGMAHHLLKLDLAQHARGRLERRVRGRLPGRLLARGRDGHLPGRRPAGRPGGADGRHLHHRHQGPHRPLGRRRRRGVLVHRPQDRALARRRAVRPDHPS